MRSQTHLIFTVKISELTAFFGLQLFSKARLDRMLSSLFIATLKAKVTFCEKITFGIHLFTSC